MVDPYPLQLGPNTMPDAMVQATAAALSSTAHTKESRPSGETLSRALPSVPVQYAEDAEDARPTRREPLILPPRYKEAWGRPAEPSEDGAGVFRAVDGGSKP